MATDSDARHSNQQNPMGFDEFSPAAQEEMQPASLL
jgi:hypothetical protein